MVFIPDNQPYCLLRLIILRIWAAYLPSFYLFGGHDDDSRVLLKNHPPEVTDGVM